MYGKPWSELHPSGCQVLVKEVSLAYILQANLFVRAVMALQLVRVRSCPHWMAQYDLIQFHTDSTLRSFFKQICPLCFIQYLKRTLVPPDSYLFRLHSFNYLKGILYYFQRYYHYYEMCYHKYSTCTRYVGVTVLLNMLRHPC